MRGAVSPLVSPVYLAPKAHSRPRKIPSLLQSQGRMDTDGNSTRIISKAVNEALHGPSRQEDIWIRLKMPPELLLVLLVLSLLMAAVITFLYCRTLRENRGYSAMLQYLVWLLSGQKEEDGGSSPILSCTEKETDQDVDAESNIQKHSYDDKKSIMKDLGLPDPGLIGILPSKITLAPLQGEKVIRFPSAHLSHVKLPNIQGNKTFPRRREKKKQNDNNVTDAGDTVNSTNDGRVDERSIEDVMSPKSRYEVLDVSQLKSKMSLSDSQITEDQPPSYEELERIP